MTHALPLRRRAGMQVPLASLALLSALAAPPTALAQAQDIAWSGFATIGYAQSSDAPGRYLRWIDGNGTFNADSVAALQADWRINPRWSATVQLKAAPSDKSDHQWQLRPAWAFLAWRPDDAWLVRAGRMRLPLYLYSESLDVGVAQGMARLPLEMYSIIPTNEYNGVSVGHTRATSLLPDGELAVEAYAGRIGTTARFWLRDGAPPQLPAGEHYVSVNVSTFGLLTTLRNARTTLRLGVHAARTTRLSGERTPVDYPFVPIPIAPGLGYYMVDDAMPGPPLASVARIRNIITTLGVEQQLGDGWRVAAELARNQQLRTQLGSNTLGGYATLFREMGDFTPYVSVGRLRTSDAQMQRYRQLIGTQLPAIVPGAAQINAAQRVAAESIYVANQSSWALGMAWHTPWGGSLKVEHASTRIGETTRLIDTPPGQPSPENQRFGTWRLSYSVAY